MLPCCCEAGLLEEGANKCPFWMSSTQWGKVETVGDEGAVSGYTCGAWATACALLWACGGLCKGTQISASRRGACVLICIYATDPKKLVTCPAQHRAYEFFLFALPPTREWVRLIRGGCKRPTGAGSGGWELSASRLVASGPVRFYWQLNTKPKPEISQHGEEIPPFRCGFRRHCDRDP